MISEVLFLYPFGIRMIHVTVLLQSFCFNGQLKTCINTRLCLDFMWLTHIVFLDRWSYHTLTYWRLQETWMCLLCILQYTLPCFNWFTMCRVLWVNSVKKMSTHRRFQAETKQNNWLNLKLWTHILFIRVNNKRNFMVLKKVPSDT